MPEIIKIDQLPTPDEAEQLLYNENKSKKEGYIDFIKKTINDELSKYSALYLKNNKIAIALKPSYDYNIVEEVAIIACDELRENGFLANYEYSPGGPGGYFFNVQVSINDEELKNPPTVYIDTNNRNDKDEPWYEAEFEGEIKVSTDKRETYKIGKWTNVEKFRERIKEYHKTGNKNCTVVFNEDGMTYKVRNNRIGIRPRWFNL